MDEDYDLEEHLPATTVSAGGDPATLGWPPSLPLEIALREHSPQDICAAYGIDLDQWNRLRKDPGFQSAVVKFSEQLKTEGMGFKLKAQLQSEALLQKSWKIIHDPDTPAAVKADLIKYTWKCSGHDKSADVGVGMANAFQIQINL